MKAVKAQSPTEATEPTATATPSALLSHEEVERLRAPFPKDSLGVKVQSLSKDRSKAMLVLYLQHTDVMDRLEQVDPAWTSEVTGEERAGDTVYARIRLTLKGVSRENVGEGGDPKAAYSDALKRAAMLFGVGRYLYDSVIVWVDYNESRDRFKQWTVEEYERAARGFQVPAPKPAAAGPAPVVAKGKAPAAPRSATAAPTGAASSGEAKDENSGSQPGLKTSKKGPPRTRDQLNRVLMNLYRPYLARFPDTRFVELLQDRYNVGETRLMSLDQIEDLVQYMEERLKSVA